MKTCITTLATSNWFQHYLPMYIYILRKEYPEYYVRTFITGETDALTHECLNYLRSNGVNLDPPIEIFEDIKLIKSTANSLRFLIPENYFNGMDQVLFTDCDLLLFRNDPTLLKWHLKRMKAMNTCYAGHHGPKHHIFRPEISPEGWKGRFERVSGGFLMVTPKWFRKTKAARKKYLRIAMKGKLGGFREFDEVMLGRIMRKSGLPMPPMGFCMKQRGIHLGDFKLRKSRIKRKMRKRLVPQMAKNFIELTNDPIWCGLIEILRQDDKITKIIKKAYSNLGRRVK